MIAEFLRQEYASTERYSAHIQACLAAEGASSRIITEANLADATQNSLRRRVLGRYRGYDTGQPSFFTDFPGRGVDWQWVALTPDELLDSMYIRYEFWSRLSDGTRSPRTAAARIRGNEAFGDGTAAGELDRFLALVDCLTQGLQLPPVILVSADGGATRVVLEGHSRLTAYAMVPDTIPSEIEALLGTSADIARWDEY